jgi:type I restriction enzyme S subunit
LPILIPPIAEQTAIANYLDTATSKIDAAIAQQQKMIDLLNESKQIIINRAVTKGLNPNAKMKDSGVEWIGEVPEGWEVRKLKHIAKLQSGDTISSDSFTETGYPVFGGNGFRGYTNRYTNDGDYVLIGRQGALCGNVNYAHGQFFASEHAVVVYPHKHESIVWLGEVIRTSNLNQYSQSAAQPGLAVSLIQNICYPYPPKEEREGIALYIAKNIKVIDEGIKNYQEQISLLQERKQIIINEVVTGKVMVCKEKGK